MNTKRGQKNKIKYWLGEIIYAIFVLLWFLALILPNSTDFWLPNK